MGFLGKLILKTVTNAAALWLAVRYIPGFGIQPHAFFDPALLGVSALIQSLIAGGLALAVLNLILRPVLKLISYPFIVLTFGLFHVVINIAILYLAARYLPVLVILGFWPLFWGSLLIGVVNAVF